jgi:hypothetical protein
MVRTQGNIKLDFDYTIVLRCTYSTLQDIDVQIVLSFTIYVIFILAWCFSQIMLE